MALRFKFSEDKALEALCWIAREWPGVTAFYVSKIMFYAEKFHLNRYGRPIMADTFKAMENGPVPSTVLNYINGHERAAQMTNRVRAAVRVTPNHGRKHVEATREPNAALLSDSDIECLRDALALCRNMSFGQLSDMTHRERAWANADLNQTMDYEDFIDADNPHRDEIIERAQMHAAHGVL
jgi:uncharacterized phage-associated protein